ncbi:hypothetical protein SAMN04244553_1658 [Nocardia amikacinitolerans]|uniref:Uncharacterized protein n=1 Tax=Nocardia amikacinitolerans TaxID=756689 RepID=A0A285L880_9NOCA|nr:hypothetical protein [Nocardia amikacinitolerans]SNY79591.1 hypothetical protein SAMN04244553_1658 [Nocardia amikacinitolerans]
MKIIVLLLLAPFLWPFYLVVWCFQNPDKTKQAFGRVRESLRRHPGAWTWAVATLGLLIGIGNLFDAEPGGAAAGFAIVAGCMGVLWKLRRNTAAEIAAALSARADAQHLAYLRGDEWGTYGTRNRPAL